MSHGNQYEMETLIKTFMDHHEKSIENNTKMIERHKEYFPNEEIPDYLKDEFSISKAFAHMAMEIQRIKRRCKLK